MIDVSWSIYLTHQSIVVTSNVIQSVFRLANDLGYVFQLNFVGDDGPVESCGLSDSELTRPSSCVVGRGAGRRMLLHVVSIEKGTRSRDAKRCLDVPTSGPSHRVRSLEESFKGQHSTQSVQLPFYDAMKHDCWSVALFASR